MSISNSREFKYHSCVYEYPMEMVWHISISKIEALIHENENALVDEKNFLMCKSCFWCASFLTGKRNSIRCPSCGSSNIELMSISDYESYKLDYEYINDMFSHLL